MRKNKDTNIVNVKYAKKPALHDEYEVHYY